MIPTVYFDFLALISWVSVPFDILYPDQLPWNFSLYDPSILGDLAGFFPIALSVFQTLPPLHEGGFPGSFLSSSVLLSLYFRKSTLGLHPDGGSAAGHVAAL